MATPTLLTGATPAASSEGHEQTQCHTCRKRRIRCDQTKPACLKCQSKNLTCPGYTKQKPLVWLAGGGKQNEYIRAEAGGTKGRRKKGRPKVEVAADAEAESATQAQKSGDAGRETAVVKATGNSESLLVSGVVIPPSLKLSCSPKVRKIVQTLCYFDELLYPDLNPIVYNPTYHCMDPKVWQHSISQAIWEILIAVVATHKTIRSRPSVCNGSGNDSNHYGMELSREIFQHRSQAFHILSQELRQPATQLNGMTLICVMTMFLAETQLSALGDWWTHLEGANRIIELRGGLAAVFKEEAWMQRDLTYLVIADVMSATTLGSLPVNEAQRQLGYLPLLDTLYDDGSGTCMPCPNELLDAIIQINHLRATSPSALGLVQDGGSNGFHHDPATQHTVFKAAVRDLLNVILSFSAPRWASKMMQRYASEAANIPKAKPNSRFIQPTRDDWLRIGGVYHAAVLVYCIQSLALDFDELLRVPCPTDAAEPLPMSQSTGLSSSDIHGNANKEVTSSYVTIHDIHLVAKQTLRDHIRAIFSPAPNIQPGDGPEKPQSLGKVCTWPLFIAGLQAAVDFDSFLLHYSSDATTPLPNEDLEFACACLHAQAVEIGTLNLHDACAFLRREWALNCEKWMTVPWSPGGETKWWSEIFQDMVGRCCFFL